MAKNGKDRPRFWVPRVRIPVNHFEVGGLSTTLDLKKLKVARSMINPQRPTGTNW